VREAAMWWTRCERRRRRGGRGGACCGDHGADDQDGVDGAVLDGERVEHSAPTGPQPRGRPRPAHRNSFHRHRLCAAWQCGRARGRDDGRILVTVVSTSRLPVVAEMSRARWPSSPSARSCGCLHRGSNAQAVSKTGEAARSHVPMASASGVALRRARSLRSRAGAGADIARARPRARARAACAPASRAQRQGRPRLRRMRGGRPGWGAHLWMVGWYPWAVKRLVTT
jgi:hypothetical protein